MNKIDNRKYSQEEIAVIVQSALGKTFGELNNFELKTFNKGSFGHIFEEDVFDYDINSFSEPDFIDAGIELKVTPYKINKDKSLSAKERLVFNIIDYENEYKNEFDTSHFWFKNNKLQIIWYLWEANKNKDEFKITNEKLLNLAESEDLEQIKEDWYTIINKIKNGKAHEISEADTMYLGACTKGKDSSSLRKQPKSDIMAKQRAFCFKTSYMTQLVRKYIGSFEDVEKILANTTDTFNSFVNKVISKYKGYSQRDLIKEFNIDTTAKNINDLIVRNMFNVKGNLGKTDEFLKANIIPRTVRIEENNRIIESMPFPTFKYNEIINEAWDDSELKNTLECTKYMFFVFKKENNDYIFKGIKLWNMPESVIEQQVKEVWNKTVCVIKSGNIVKKILPNGNRSTNFPGMSENSICHVRPHAIDSNDTYDLPVKDKLTGLTSYTKHCFWINNKYLEEILSDISA